ncbi:MAG TPA: apolipoprotein N-acyltransferase [Phycisphaerae bacterium]|nr:apolipoprotein N-acyltransferase [Phycisphaerae bacterium]
MQSRWAILGLLCLSLLLQSVIFAPVDIWPAAFICLLPWFIVIGASGNATVVYVTSYLLGLAFFLINVRWLAVCTPPGWIAMSMYLAVYYPLVACPVRHAVRRRRIPLAFVAPVVWVGSEMCRAVVISGFPWFFMGHSQYRVLTLIQISDLVGAYGVSFLVVAVNGTIADLILNRLRGRWSAGYRGVRGLRAGVAFAVVLVLFTCIYGQIQLRRDTSSPGPVIAVLQEDFPNFTDPERDRQQPSDADRARAYATLFDRIARDGHQPDLFLLPESPWWMALNPELRQIDPQDPTVERYLRLLSANSRASYDMLQEQVAATGAYVVTGGFTVIPTPYAVRAADLKHNSAYVFAPGGALPKRYDKVHCVYFGEVVPFRYGRLRFVYLWLDPLMPFHQEGYEYSLTPGTEFKAFSMTPRRDPGRTYRFGVPICYEDVMPYVSRRFVTDPESGLKHVDFLLNISNDGWFVHSNELPQHLAICAFRAVENRVGIARAVNTGISGFIDADGRIHDLVEVDGVARGEGVRGYSVAAIDVDRRHSVYSCIGDVFAIACAVLGLLTYVDYVAVRALTARRSGDEREGAA